MRPLPRDEDLARVDVEDGEVEDDERQQQVLREELQSLRIGALGALLRLRNVRRAGEREERGEDRADRDEELQVRLRLDRLSPQQKLVDREHRHGESAEEHAAEEERLQRTEEERLVELPEAEQRTAAEEAGERDAEVGGEHEETEAVDLIARILRRGDGDDHVDDEQRDHDGGEDQVERTRTAPLGEEGDRD